MAQKLISILAPTLIGIICGILAAYIPGLDQRPAGRSVAVATWEPVSVPTVLANLSGDGHPRIRLDLVAMMKGDRKSNETILNELSQDIVAYLGTVALARIEGTDGFDAVRDDLVDIAVTRGDGAINDLLLRSFVID